MDEQQLRRRLKIEASEIRVTPPPDAWDAVKTGVQRRPRKLLAVAVAAAAVAIAAVAIPLVLTDRQTVTDVTATPPSQEQERVGPEEGLACFFRARVLRIFDRFEGCMSQRLFDSYGDPVEFIGASSGNIERFTITDELERTDDRIVVQVRVYTGTRTELLAYSNDTVTVIREPVPSITEGVEVELPVQENVRDLDFWWVVDDWEQGEEVQVTDVATISVHLPTFIEGSLAGSCSDLMPAERLIPAEDGNPQLLAVQELVMGPRPPAEGWGAPEGSSDFAAVALPQSLGDPDFDHVHQARLFPRGTIVDSVSGGDGQALVELILPPRHKNWQSLDPEDIDNVLACTPEEQKTALERTLAPFGITEVTIRAR